MRNLASFVFIAFAIIILCGTAYACVSQGAGTGGDGAYPLGEYGEP